MSHTKGWNREAVRLLLRWADRHDGPWDEFDDCLGSMPREKDADLVVAVHDLLAACETVIRRGHYETCSSSLVAECDCDCGYSLAVAAIKKAKGEE